MSKLINIHHTAKKYLLYDRANSLGALLGIVISTFLIGQQIGVFTYLIDGITKLATINEEYIWVVDNKTENVNSLHKLDVRIGREVASLPGINKAYPMYMGSGSIQFEGEDHDGVTLVGVQPPDFAGAPELFEGKYEDLLQEGAFSSDIHENRVFKDNRIGATFEINKRQAHLAAHTNGVLGFGRAFSFTTIERARAVSNGSQYLASAFLVKTTPDVSQEEAINIINNNIHGVRAWKSTDFKRATIIYYLKHSSIVLSLGTMVVFAFLAGIAVVGLTLYSSAIDHIRDYGTMKAIGATNGYIRQLLYMQAMMFAIPGFLIGQVLVQIFKYAIESQGLLIQFTPQFYIYFFLLVCVIALSGAALASRRIIRLEPAEVFRF